MKYLIITSFLIIFCNNISSQSIDVNISAKIENENGYILNVSSNNDDTDSEIPFIDITINENVNIITFKDYFNNEDICINKNDTFLKKIDYNYSLFTKEAEKKLLDIKYKEILLYNTDMKEIKFVIGDIIKVKKSIEECFQVFNKNYIVMGNGKEQLLKECIDDSIIILRKGVNDKYPKFILGDYKYSVWLNKYVEFKEFENGFTDDFFKYLSYGYIDRFGIKRKYKEYDIYIEFDLNELKSVIDNKLIELELKPNNAKI